MSLYINTPVVIKRSRSASNISSSSISKIPKLDINIIDIKNIFTPNNIVYSNIKDGDKQLSTFTDYRSCLNLNDFNSYCYNNSISDNIYSFSMNALCQANCLLNSIEYQNLSSIERECILIATMVAHIKIFDKQDDILNCFKITKNHTNIINELFQNIELNNPSKMIESWKLIPKYILITMKVGETDLNEICNNSNDKLTSVKYYLKIVNQFENNFKNEYLKNIFLSKKCQMNNICDYIIKNNILIDENTISDFYS